MDLVVGRRRILCFGDSNTYGIVPGTRQRYAPHERWPGIVQARLGDAADVHEEGLPGRLTDLEDAVLGRSGCDGLAYLRPWLASRDPMDVVVLALGTNDLRPVYQREPDDVAVALSRYLDHVDQVSSTTATTRVVVVAPTPMDETAVGFLRDRPVPEAYDEATAAATRALPAALRSMAEERDAPFVDLGSRLRVGEDGAHLDLDSHRLLGEAVAEVILA